jgi:ADP-heptose:LPS heptosyltransferase
MPKQTLILRHRLALGDAVLFTGLIRDINRAYPDRFDICIDSHFREVWANNHNARLVHKNDSKGTPKPLDVRIRYVDGITAAGRGQKVHMLSWYHKDFEKKTRLPVPVTEPKGDLHLVGNEQDPVVQGRYWVIVAGGKSDVTNKLWLKDNWQSLIYALRKVGITCVQVGATHNRHIHHELNGVVNLVGKLPSSRDLFNVIYHSEGVICPVTAAMHIAACYDKPCVVIAGGREEPWWEAYTNTFKAFGPHCTEVAMEHRFLHTIGLLSCCTQKGCWKKRTVPIEPDDHKPGGQSKLCKMPVHHPDMAIAKCMDMISPEHVLEAVMSYYEDGKIPPIEPPKGKHAGLFQAEDSPAKGDTLGEPPSGAKAPDGDTPTEGAPQLIPLGQLKGIPVTMPGEEYHEVKVIREPVRPPDTPGRKKIAAAAVDPLKNLNHPTIGGKYTLFILCYGPYPGLARACLDSILATVPASRLDIRVACNDVPKATIDYLESQPITKLYVSKTNAKKYPMMRQMFWDEECPIKTNYVLWFDDDTCVVSPDWLTRLSALIVSSHPHGNRMYGWRMFHNLQMFSRGGHQPIEWFRQAPWYRGRHLRVSSQGAEAPNGSVIDFATGWFWALATETIRQGDIPDTRLLHNSGDITIGEQVHQAGCKIAMFNKGKVFVFTPPKNKGGRRGYSESFPWADPATRQRHKSGQ